MARKRAMGDAVPSDERADNARRPDGPVPSGAGGGPSMTVLASLERRPALLRSAVGVPALPRISGATPASGDAMQGAARGQMPPQCIGDEPEHSSVPRSRRPSGLARGRTASLLVLLDVCWNSHAVVGPSRIRSGHAANAPRALGGPEPPSCSPGASRAAPPYLRIGSKRKRRDACSSTWPLRVPEAMRFGKRRRPYDFAEEIQAGHEHAGALNLLHQVLKMIPDPRWAVGQSLVRAQAQALLGRWDGGDILGCPSFGLQVRRLYPSAYMLDART